MEKKTEIEFDAKVERETGFLKVANDPASAPRKEPAQSLLRLLFHFTYTKEGRKFLADNRPTNRRGSGPIEQIIAANKEAMRPLVETEFRKFAISDDSKISDEVITALVEAHFAADLFLRGPELEKVQWQEEYRTHLETIMTALHNDAMSKEFSINW
jgi:hypothetical protein